jgi:predicted PurR-regulated permease PerM
MRGVEAVVRYKIPRATMDRPVSNTVRSHFPAPRGSMSVRALAVIAILALLYVGHAAFIPIALAGLLALILTGPVEALHRIGVPRSVAALVVVLILAALVGASINLLWTPAQNWWAAAPQTLRAIERKARPISQFMSRVEVLTDRADQLADPGNSPPAHAAEHAGGTAAAQIVVVPGNEAAAAQPARSPIAMVIFDQTRTVVMSLLTVTMVMLFLLSGGPPMLARMSGALASDLQSTHTLRVINAVRTELSRYFGGLAIINLGLGGATAGVMALLNMPNPLLWGAVACVLNFIPYVGSATTLLLLLIVAFVTFSGLGHVALVGACYLALATVEGQVVQPLVIGRRLELNPMIVFLALWFGGWFWGIAGIVMAVPALVSLKVVAAHSLRGKPLTEFLGPNGVALVPIDVVADPLDPVDPVGPPQAPVRRRETA